MVIVFLELSATIESKTESQTMTDEIAQRKFLFLDLQMLIKFGHQFQC